MKASAIRLLLGAALLLPLAPAWPAETIRIAFVGGLSGPYALQDEEALKSVEMIADIVNMRGGVLGGKKIEIIAFDNQDYAYGQAVARAARCWPPSALMFRSWVTTWCHFKRPTVKCSMDRPSR